MLLERLQDFHRVLGHRAQITVLGAGVHVDHRLHIVMRDHQRPGRGGQLHQVAQHLRALHAGIVYRHVHQVLHRGHAVLRGLDRYLVGHAVLGIQPEVRRGLEAAAQRDQHGLRHVARIHSHLRGLVAVNLQMQRRQT